MLGFVTQDTPRDEAGEEAGRCHQRYLDILRCHTGVWVIVMMNRLGIWRSRIEAGRVNPSFSCGFFG